jgi:hypothetical protein
MWLHNGTLPNGTLQTNVVTVQNDMWYKTVRLQNGNHYKTVTVTKRFVLQNSVRYKR